MNSYVIIYYNMYSYIHMYERLGHDCVVQSLGIYQQNDRNKVDLIYTYTKLWINKSIYEYLNA